MSTHQRPSLPIGVRFAVLISGLLIVTVVLFGGVAHLEIRRSALEAAGQRLQTVARETSRLIDGSAATLRTQLTTLAKRPLIQEALREPDGDSARALIAAIRRQEGPLLGMHLLDANGGVVVAAGPEVPAAAPEELRALIALLADTLPAASGELRFIDDSLAFPSVARVTDNQRVLGYAVQWRRLVNSEANRVQLTSLIGSAARLSIGNSRGDVWSNLVTAVRPPPGDVRPDPARIYRIDRSDGRHLAMALPLNGAQWILFVEFPYATILAHLPPTIVRLGLAAALLLLLGVICAWRMSRTVTQPIEELSAATSAVRAGDYTRRVAIRRHDELGELSQLFNQMADAVSTGNEQIERQLGRLKALRAIDLAILGTTDRALLLQSVLTQVMTQLRADAAAIFIFNPHTLTVDTSASIGYRTREAEREKVRLGDGVAGKAARERRTIAVPDLATVEMSDGLRKTADREGIRAVYAVPLIAKGSVIGVLDVFFRQPYSASDDWIQFCEALAGQAAMAIESGRSFDELQRTNMELSLAYDTTIEGWSRALDMRDRETEGHSQRVTDMTLRLARLAGIDEATLIHVRRGALLHDIGKMAIPDTILHKPGPLDEAEWRIMREHPTHAFRLLQPIPYLRPALDIPRYHHERWDGTGYPYGLKGADIPLPVRLFTVVDVWDALRSDRPYRRGWSDVDVHDYLRARSASEFDPEAVALFFRALASEPNAAPGRLDSSIAGEAA
jgi:HD-GYP domain-containing protein (c-di-GMP phosphodiesterase class II)